MVEYKSGSEFQYEISSKEELLKQVSNIKIDNETMNIPIFDGFYFFSPLDFQEDEIGTQFVVAKYNEEIVGILKYKRYKVLTHEFVKEDEKFDFHNYLAIRFINVHNDWKRKGIARDMLKFFAENVYMSKGVVMSQEVYEGKIAKINTTAEGILGMYFYRNLEDFEEDYYMEYPDNL